MKENGVGDEAIISEIISKVDTNNVSPQLKIHPLTNHVMTRKQYTKTQDMTYLDTSNQSDSADACTCGGLYCSTELIVTMFHPPRIRLALKYSRPPATLTT